MIEINPQIRMKNKIKKYEIHPPLAELRISYGATRFARSPIRRVVGLKETRASIGPPYLGHPLISGFSLSLNPEISFLIAFRF